MPDPVVTVDGSATLMNAVDLTRKRTARTARMNVYADHVEFSGLGIEKLTFPLRAAARDQISRIYPIVIRTPLLRWHPLIRGRSHIKIVMKSRGRYDGNDQYWLAFDQPAAPELLDVLENAGYPVDRRLRTANLMTGEDTQPPR